MKEDLEVLVQALMDLEVLQQIEAEKHERTSERTTHRNGYRPRTWETRVGALELRIPKLRQGSYFPSFLEPRWRSEEALLAVIQEAYVFRVSTRKIDDLVQTLGLNGISTSEVSWICKELDEAVERFRHRPLSGSYPYLWLDAT